MWQLSPVNKNSYNCFQFLVTTIANFLNCDYRLMMLELWGFLYDEATDGTIGDRLRLYWNSKTDKRKHLLNFHGLSFDIIPIQAFDAKEMICENLERGPVAVYIDSFNCSWVPFYQKIHRPHALFVLDSKSDKFIFLDQYSNSIKKNEIDLEFTNANVTDIIIFKESKKLPKISIKNAINDHLNDWEQYGFSNYKTFVFEMKNCFDISNEINSDPVASKLVMLLKNLADDRKNFIEAIDLFEECLMINLDLTKACLIDISTRYEKLRAYFLKCAISNRVPKPKLIADELDNIYLIERQIYERMRMIVK